MSDSKIFLIVIGVIFLGAVVRMKDSIYNLIQNFEGFSATPYNDPPGSDKYSIGYGHQILPGEDLTNITQAEGLALLIKDTEKARAAVDNAIIVPLSTEQYSALVSFVYNVGVGGFQNGTVPAKLNAGNFQAAADTMRQYIHAAGKVSKVLVDRRNKEASVFDVA